jgi:hypothetical protein
MFCFFHVVFATVVGSMGRNGIHMGIRLLAVDQKRKITFSDVWAAIRVLLSARVMLTKSRPSFFSDCAV